MHFVACGAPAVSSNIERRHPVVMSLRRRTSSLSAAAAASRLYIVVTLLSFMHINSGQAFDIHDQRLRVLYGKDEARVIT